MEAAVKPGKKWDKLPNWKILLNPIYFVFCFFFCALFCVPKKNKPDLITSYFRRRKMRRKLRSVLVENRPRHGRTSRTAEAAETNTQPLGMYNVWVF